jgi:hypothetical protein
MKSIMRWARRVIQDLVNLRHVDAYVVAFIGVVLVVFGVVGAPEVENYLLALTAGMVILLFRTTVPNEKIVDLDAVLRDRQSYSPLREFIQGGRVVWVYGPSAANVLRESAAIKREILDRGGELRVLLQDPGEAASMNILRQQLDPNNNLDHDIQGTLFTLEKMRAWGKVDFRLLPYSPGFSLLVVDPDGTDGRLTVEFYGYHNNMIDDRMHVEIERRASHYWFEYWEKQYRIMWESAKPYGAAAEVQSTTTATSA